MSTEDNEAVRVEAFFARLNGSMDMVIEACALLIAADSRNKTILSQLADRLKPVTQTDSVQERHSKIGAARALSMLAGRTDFQESAAAGAGIPPQDKH